MCPGTCLDYAFENVRTPWAYAFEIYGAPTVPLRARGRRKQRRRPRAGGKGMLALLELPDDAAMGAAVEPVRLHEVSVGSCFLQTLESTSRGGRQQQQQLVQRMSPGERGLLAELVSDASKGAHPELHKPVRLQHHQRQQRLEERLSGTAGQQQSLSVQTHGSASAGALATGSAAESAGLSGVSLMSHEDCLGFFNPLTRRAFDRTLAAWSARTGRLLQLVHAQVMKDRGDGQQHT